MGTPSRTYVVRIWFEPCVSGDVWRASATDVRTQEKHYFKSQAELNRFLEEVEGRGTGVGEGPNQVG
ncbi:MAG: hypothetical protein SFU83_18680 [Meiothermus sp.]|nr:hypothetical protein [Meiothermus sp.]